MNKHDTCLKERERIANHIRKVARDLLSDKKSTPADGYCAGILLDLAEAIQNEDKFNGTKV